MLKWFVIASQTAKTFLRTLGQSALVLAVCLATPYSLAATELISLQYRMADELQPTLQSLLGAQGRIVSHGNQLLINADPQQISEVKALVQQLDTEPQMLLISIDRSGQQHFQEDNINLGGKISINGHPVIIDNQRPRQITRNNTQNNQQGIEQVRTLEGSTVMLSNLQQQPVQRYQRYPNGHIREYTDYQNTGTRLQLRVQLQGQRVLLTLDDQSNQPAHNDYPRPTQQISSQITTELGRWTELGSISESQQQQQQGLASRRQAHSQQTSGIKIKVQRLN